MKNLVIIAITAILLMILQPVKCQVITPDPQMLKELKSYAITRIKPVTKPYREKLESELTIGEKKQIHALRMQLDEIRRKRVAAHLTFGERLGKSELNDAQQSIIASDRKQIRKIMVEALSIADKHELLLDKISTATKKDRIKWRKDMKEIIIKYKGNDAGIKLGRLEALASAGSVHPALFVLWDPEREYLK